MGNKFRIFTMTLGLAGILSTGATGQQSNLRCPAVDVVASADLATDGDSMTFHVVFSGGNMDLTSLKYNWVVDRGKIAGGQGSPVAIIDTAGQGSAGSITATVAVDLGPICEGVASETTLVKRKGPQTKEDIFWKWFQKNQEILFRDEPSTVAEELNARLNEVNPDLMFELGPRTQNADLREFIIVANENKSVIAAMNVLVERAPILVNFRIKTRSSEGRIK